MTGLGGLRLIDGHHLDTTGGDIITTMDGIITVGGITTGSVTGIMVGTITMDKVGEEVITHTSTGEEGIIE